MKVGLTYDLRSDYLAMGLSEHETAEFDREDTIASIQSALQSAGFESELIGNVHALTNRLVNGDRWDIVFNIAEGVSGFAREAQVPTVLEIYQIPYTFSDPLTLSLTLHKGFAKRVMRNAGFRTPDFCVVEEIQQVRDVGFEPPYFVKPIAEGSSKGVAADSIIGTRGRLRSACERLLREHAQPVLVEVYLPGREFTIGILGSGGDATVLGTLEVILTEGAEREVHSYHNKQNCVHLVKYRRRSPEDDEVVRKSEIMALGLWRLLGCRDAGRVDIRCDKYGSPSILEVNALPGLSVMSDLVMLGNAVGMPYVELIRRILESASKRL